MIYNFFTKILTCLLVFGLVGLYLAGCAGRQYKQEADEQVYNIIDEKWQQDFGSKVNYRLSETRPAPNPASGKLTLPEAVALATAYNRQYQSQKEALYTKALDLTLTRHEFDEQFFGGAGSRYSRDGNDEGIGAKAEFGFNRLLAGGARISTNVAAAWAGILTGNLRSGLISVLSATITQPLLRGSGRRVVQENLTQAERDTLYQVRLFNRFRKTFVVSVISQYYQVLLLSDASENARSNYKMLLKVKERVEKLAEAGRVPRLEAKRVRQEELQAGDTFIQVQKQYKQALDQFKITLALPTDANLELDTSELDALRAAVNKPPDFTEAEAVETALASRLDLANSADAVIDAERKVVVAADGLKADLTLFGTARAVSSERGNVRRLKRWQDFVDAGVELDLPLDRLEERNIFRKALITLNQQQRQHELAADTVKLEVRQAYRDLTEAADRYRVQLENLKLARERFDDTSLLLRYGRASSRRVLNAQDDLFDAQDAATGALVDYAVANLNFYRDTGVLQVRPDGMWEH